MVSYLITGNAQVASRMIAVLSSPFVAQRLQKTNFWLMLLKDQMQKSLHLAVQECLSQVDAAVYDSNTAQRYGTLRACKKSIGHALAPYYIRVNNAYSPRFSNTQILLSKLNATVKLARAAQRLATYISSTVS